MFELNPLIFLNTFFKVFLNEDIGTTNAIFGLGYFSFNSFISSMNSVSSSPNSLKLKSSLLEFNNLNKNSEGGYV